MSAVFLFAPTERWDEAFAEPTIVIPGQGTQSSPVYDRDPTLGVHKKWGEFSASTGLRKLEIVPPVPPEQAWAHAIQLGYIATEEVRIESYYRGRSTTSQPTIKGQAKASSQNMMDGVALHTFGDTRTAKIDLTCSGDGPALVGNDRLEYEVRFEIEGTDIVMLWGQTSNQWELSGTLNGNPYTATMPGVNLETTTVQVELSMANQQWYPFKMAVHMADDQWDEKGLYLDNSGALRDIRMQAKVKATFVGWV